MQKRLKFLANAMADRAFVVWTPVDALAAAFGRSYSARFVVNLPSDLAHVRGA